MSHVIYLSPLNSEHQRLCVLCLSAIPSKIKSWWQLEKTEPSVVRIIDQCDNVYQYMSLTSRWIFGTFVGAEDDAVTPTPIDIDAEQPHVNVKQRKFAVGFRSPAWHCTEYQASE